MIKALTSTALVLVLAPFAPAAAEAQVYPDRVRIAAKARAVVESTYQRRRDENNREENVERTTRTLKLGANGVLTLGNIAGDIAITRATGPDTTVEIVKTARGRDANDVREQLQMVQVDVTERAGRADIRTRYPSNEEARRNNRRNFNVSVAYNVSAPAGTRISVESISGSIKVTDIKGDVTANSVSGDVRITGSGRINAAKTISGTVEIADAEIDGALESSSVSGDVIMRRVTARRLDASSVSGAVAFVGTLARNGRYDLGSFSGDVHLYLSGGTGFEVDANSSSGDIRSDFDIVTRGAQTTTRRGRRPVLSGTFGDGSAVLDLTTFSGSIIISKR